MLYLSKFEYLAPQTSEEACSFLSQYKDKAKILAGGTDLLPKMKQDIERPQYLVDIKNIDGLSSIDYNERDGLWLGALVTISDLVASPIVNHTFGILGEAARTMASRQVRNRATIGGNLCNASPAADTAPALISLGGQASIVGLNGERVVPLEGFFSGPGRSVLRGDEILNGIQVPNPLPHTGGAYLKLSPREKDLATVAVAALIALNSEGTICEDARVVLGAVAPTVIRAFEAEKALMGKTVTEAVIQESAQMALEESQPITDIRGSAEYRKEMVAVQARRAIKRALELAKSV
jgi:CO/xanthine dehydrogenase FAD-binding subunit